MKTKTLINGVAHSIADPVAFAKLVYGFRQISPKHAELLRMNSEINIIVAGRRFGKTTYLAAKAFHFALLHRNATVLITAPSVDQARIYFDLLTSALEKHPFDEDKPHPLKSFIAEVKNAPFPEVYLTNGSKLLVRSTARGGRYLRGRKVHAVFVTEAAFVDDDVFENVIMPMRLDTKAKIYLESTPYARNFFFKLYQEGLRENNEYIKSFHATVYDNPWIDKDEIEKQREKLPENVFSQEYMAEFVDDGKAVFTWNLLKRAFDDDYEPLGYVPGHKYVIGLDIAQVQDYTVFIVLDITREPYKIAEILRFNNTTYDEIIDWANELSEKYMEHPERSLGYAPVYVDATTVGRPIAEKIKNAVPITLSIRSKTEIIENLQLLIAQNKLKLPPSEQLLRDELRYYKYDEGSKTIRMSAPKNFHDDMVIALALACWEVHEGAYEGSFSINF